MLNRFQYIEQIRRQVYGGQPSDESEITIGLVNKLLNQAIGYAAQTNYTDSLKIDGIAYVNSSFYITYKNLTVTKDSNFLWKVTLPEIPVGIGANEGCSTCMFTDGSQVSYPIVWMTQNQKSYARGMRGIPNKVLGYQQGGFVYAQTTIMLSQFTATIEMVSGGDSTDLNSTLNVPPDYIPFMTDYLVKILTAERFMPKDVTPDGNDAIKFT